MLAVQIIIMPKKTSSSGSFPPATLIHICGKKVIFSPCLFDNLNVGAKLDYILALLAYCICDFHTVYVVMIGKQRIEREAYNLAESRANGHN